MIYVSIDIETTGLNPEECEVLSIGAIIEDTKNILPYDELPKFHVAILHENVKGSLFALNMNKELIETIVDYQTCANQDEKNDLVNITGMQFIKKEDAAEAFYHFLYLNGISSVDPLSMNINANQHVKAVGHNGKIVMAPMIGMKTKPVTITVAGKNFGTFDKLFLERLPRWKQVVKFRNRIIDPAILYTDWKNDDSLPGLELCKERAELGNIVSHNALEDAWDTLRVIRLKY
jgi:oligoribonuclease